MAQRQDENMSDDDRKTSIEVLDRWCSTNGFTLDRGSIRDPAPSTGRAPMSWVVTSGPEGDRVTGRDEATGVEISWPLDADPGVVTAAAAELVAVYAERAPKDGGS